LPEGRNSGRQHFFEIRQNTLLSHTGCKQFCHKNITSLKRGSYSGSNGEIFVDFFTRRLGFGFYSGNPGPEPSLETMAHHSRCILKSHPEISGPYLVTRVYSIPFNS